ncbi:retroviral-like aspartic protease family protein [Aestuariibacter sp. AA17]|uniref:Retroviral-like aspartic protease family protein n=1 Tax=Fluctibacter corallii TaxID=2984329 RepID=A0ABT3A342_9ALTE|nr:retropepsin-like aspartic protease [Aestuariibacter sp. AA17]MCV2883091.1 retroviral-like aspartic protease family protein [Aestuariibacter sp. AA17]
MLRGVFILLFAASVGLNVVLLTGGRPFSEQHPLNREFESREVDNSDVTTLANTKAPNALLPSSTLNVEHQTHSLASSVKAEIDSWLAQGDVAAALFTVQQALRIEPENVALRVLEVELESRSASARETLLAYYELFALPLNAAQKKDIERTIDTLSRKHIKALQSVSAWEVLSTFLEPLWQEAPDNDLYTLALAEAYAHQHLFAPMENILASLAPNSADARRIRAMALREQGFSHSQQNTTHTDHPSEIESEYTRLPLQRIGRHFRASLRVNNEPVELLLDTGASTSVIKASVFYQSNIGQYAKRIGLYDVNTAGGMTRGELYHIKTLKVGDYTLPDTAVMVMPLEHFDQADGLLGMNVLGLFDFKIDQQQDALYLSRLNH